MLVVAVLLTDLKLLGHGFDMILVVYDLPSDGSYVCRNGWVMLIWVGSNDIV